MIQDGKLLPEAQRVRHQNSKQPHDEQSQCVRQPSLHFLSQVHWEILLQMYVVYQHRGRQEQ